MKDQKMYWEIRSNEGEFLAVFRGTEREALHATSKASGIKATLISFNETINKGNKK